jgi:hypothetical protein
MSEAAGRIGDLAARRSHAEAALVLADWRLSRSRALAMAGTFGRLAWRAFRRRLPLSIGPERSEEKRTLALELARAHRQLSVAAYFAGDPPSIVRHASSALVQAERAGPRPSWWGRWPRSAPASGWPASTASPAATWTRRAPGRARGRSHRGGLVAGGALPVPVGRGEWAGRWPTPITASPCASRWAIT